MNLYYMTHSRSLMDYDEYWKKWLSISVEVIVNNNIIKSRKGGDVISVDNVGQAITSFGGYS
jgi:hypothetical protein